MLSFCPRGAPFRVTHPQVQLFPPRLFHFVPLRVVLFTSCLLNFCFHSCLKIPCWILFQSDFSNFILLFPLTPPSIASFPVSYFPPASNQWQWRSYFLGCRAAGCSPLPDSCTVTSHLNRAASKGTFNQSGNSLRTLPTVHTDTFHFTAVRPDSGAAFQSQRKLAAATAGGTEWIKEGLMSSPAAATQPALISHHSVPAADYSCITATQRGAAGEEWRRRRVSAGAGLL